MAICTGSVNLVTIDEEGNIYLNDKYFKGTEGLWDLLTCNKPNPDAITTNDYRKYKNIPHMTNAQLEQYEPGGNIHVSRGAKYRDVISKLFPRAVLNTLGLRFKYGATEPLIQYVRFANSILNRR
jgi:hypothetical protein